MEIQKKDGVMIFNNKNSDSNESIIQLNKLFTIDYSKNNIERLREIKIGYDKSIFISDWSGCSVVKYDSIGNFVKKFINRGQGPGEIMRNNSMLIIRDTIVVTDGSSRKIVKYDLNGNFLDQKIFIKKNPTKLVYAGNKLFGQIIEIINMKSNYLLKSKICQFSQIFDEISTIKEIEEEFSLSDIDISDANSYYCLINNKVYIGDISETDYKIKVYNIDDKPELTEIILKGYRKVKIETEHLVALHNFVNGKGGEPSRSKAQFYKVINGLWNDKYNRLWVLPADNYEQKGPRVFVDIFKENKYIGKLELPEYKTYYGLLYMDGLFLEGDYLFINDIENSKISVYNYN